MTRRALVGLASTVLAVAATDRLAVADARADDVAVHVQCQTVGRTKACPTFLLGILDVEPRVRQAPRAAADVTLYFNATGIASTDVALLRFVGDLDGAPRALELTVDLDSRGTDDEQLAQLRAALLRGLALYVAARDPSAVTTAIATPASARCWISAPVASVSSSGWAWANTTRRTPSNGSVPTRAVTAAPGSAAPATGPSSPS